MRKDRGFLYTSRVDVGLDIPPSSMSIIGSKVDSRHLTEVMLGGRKYTAPMAFKALWWILFTMILLFKLLVWNAKM